MGAVKSKEICSLEGLTATYEVESAVLCGMGKTMEPAVVTILGTVVFRMIWLLTVAHLLPTYEWLINVYVASCGFTGDVLFVIYMCHMKKIERKWH